MTDLVKRSGVPSIVAGLTAVLFAGIAISACGGDGGGESATSELASWMPADSVVYIEGTIQPEGELADNVDRISNKLTGESLGDTLASLLDNSDTSDVDFKTDVEPWLGEAAALGVTADLGDYAAQNPLSIEGGSSALDLAGSPAKDSTEVSVVVETTDEGATQAFIQKQAADTGGSTQGDYEGIEYTASGDGETVLAVTNDLLIAANSVADFESMVDANGDDSLADTEAFSDLADKAADGSLADVFVTSTPVFDAGSASGTTDDAGSGSDGESGSGADPLYGALGIDPENSGALVSLVPGDDEISLEGVTNATGDFVNGDPGSLIETFPADSVLAIGSAGVGANLNRIIEVVNEQGIEGTLEPGELLKTLDQLSGSGVDVNALVDSLETAGLFVSGQSVKSLGGALVVTSSDLKPLENSLALISTLIGQAGDAQVRPLTGDVTGFSVMTPELPGRPVVLAIKGDRFVIAIGNAAAKSALDGGGQTLADSPDYQAAVDSLSGDGIDMFADPSALGKLIRESAGNDPDAKKAADAMDKFEYIAGGGGEDDGSFEFNLGLGE